MILVILLNISYVLRSCHIFLGTINEMFNKMTKIIEKFKQGPYIIYYHRTCKVLTNLKFTRIIIFLFLNSTIYTINETELIKRNINI